MRLTNGVACCILDLPCCKPPGSQAQALATLIRRALGDRWDADTCQDAAEAILAQYGLVPKEVAKAIADTYYPVIEHGLESQSGRTDTQEPGQEGGSL